MPKNQKITTILILTTIFLLLFGAYFFFQNHPPIKATPPSLVETKNMEWEFVPEQGAVREIKSSQATLEIGGASYEGEIQSGEKVYDFMDRLRDEGKINFKERTYIGMGKFIEEINGIRGDGERYWIYYVNGKKATIGVSNYKINPGDVVSWKYEKEIY